MSRLRRLAVAGCACALSLGAMGTRQAVAEEPAAEPASDPAAEPASDPLEEEPAAKEPEAAPEEAQPPQADDGASAEPAKGVESPEPTQPAAPVAKATPATSTPTSTGTAIPDEDEQIKYDEELADFVAGSAEVGSSYDRAYATSAGERIQADTGVSSDADLFQPPPKKKKHGLGFQVRHSRLSKRLQEIFVERSAGAADQNGFSLNYSNRAEAVTFTAALGYDPLNGADGYYVERGGSPTAAGDVDYVDFRDLAWITLDVNAIGVVDLHDAVAFRFGAGLGAGFLLGQLRKTDALCTSDRVDRDCAPDPNGMQMNEKAKIPPVLPVINALVGIQGRPSKDIAINLDAGLHAFPYVALGAEFFLW